MIFFINIADNQFGWIYNLKSRQYQDHITNDKLEIIQLTIITFTSLLIIQIIKSHMSDMIKQQNFQLNKLATLLSLVQVCPSSVNSLLQSLQMDTSCYQTLQHLKTQNENVKDQSDSAMYLWKQTNKLISFIDQRKSHQSSQIINQRKLYFNKVQMEHKLEQQQELQIQDVRIDRVKSFLKNKQPTIKHLNKYKQPALIKQQAQSIQIKTQFNQTILPFESKQQPNRQNKNIHNENENKINLSNIQQNSIERQNQIKCSKQIKCIKQISIFNKNKQKLAKRSQQQFQKYPLKSRKQQYLLPQQIQKQQVISFQQKQATLSEIRRPQYQRTQFIKIKYNKYNKHNKQNKSHLQQSNQYEKTNILSSQESQTQKSQVKLLRIQTQYYQSTNHQRQAPEFYKQGPQSQVTNANSRLSNANSRLSNFTTNSNLQQNSILYNPTVNNNQRNAKRSLSPKVQGKKKKVVKLSSKNAIKQQNNQYNQKLNNKQKQQEYIHQQRFTSTKPLQTHRFNQQDSQQSQLQSEFLNCPTENRSIQQQQGYVSKTMKLIRKNSNKILPKVNSKCALNIIQNEGMTNVVPQEEPWECEEVQLQEQLKAIDQEIISRKSLNITKKNQHNQHNHQNSQYNHQNNHQYNHQNNHQYNHQRNEIISYQAQNKRERIHTLQYLHKKQKPRSNATSGYDQYLFTQNYESYKSNFLQQQMYQYQRQQSYSKQRQQQCDKYDKYDKQRQQRYDNPKQQKYDKQRQQRNDNPKQQRNDKQRQQRYDNPKQQKYDNPKQQRNEKEIRHETHEPKVVRLSLTPLLNQKRNKSPHTSRPSTNRKVKSPLK